ncbi:unnamed protein product [Rotaria sp. Silwood2]|nr:unnamed protein product [Rotaria sp. Silwood2]CAF4354458.1 unnamed protein product [Rotaria sp. Silwood2]
MLLWDQELIPQIDSLCSLRAYIHHSTIAAVHHSFVLQGIEKYAKIKRLTLLNSQHSKILIVLIQWIFDFIFGLPVYVTGNMPKLRTENSCFVSLTNVGTLIYLFTITFIISDIILSILYRRLVHYVHQASLRVHGNQQQMKRDLAVVRRVVLLNSQLALVGIPSLIFIIFSMVRPDLSPMKLMRLLLLNTNAAFCPMLIILFWITPNLRQCLIQLRNQAQQYIPSSTNQVRPVTNINRF